MITDLNQIDPDIKQNFEKQGIELTSIANQGSGNGLQLNANKLFPVSVFENKPVYMPIPITIKLNLDDKNQISSLVGDNLSEETTDAARIFYNDLINRNEIKGITDESHSKQTHQLVLNNNGQQVIRRTNFSAF